MSQREIEQIQGDVESFQMLMDHALKGDPSVFLQPGETPEAHLNHFQEEIAQGMGNLQWVRFVSSKSSFG